MERRWQKFQSHCRLLDPDWKMTSELTKEPFTSAFKTITMIELLWINYVLDGTLVLPNFYKVKVTETNIIRGEMVNLQ
jgi:hypothetical protein